MNSKLSGKIKKPPVVEEIQSKPRTEEQIQSVVKNVRNGDASHPEVVLIGEAELQRMKNNATDIRVV